MSATDGLQYVAWALYAVVFVLVSVRAFRRPTHAHLNMALFFGAAVLIIVSSVIPAALRVAPPPWLTSASGAVTMALPYLLLRLVADFTGVARWFTRLTGVGLILSVVALAVLPSPVPTAATMALIAFFVVVISYDTVAFIREARRTRGVTRRRMQAVAVGSCFLAADIVCAGLAGELPGLSGLWIFLGNLCGAGSGVSYFFGFAPPTWMRRAWQEPELRALLGLATQLRRLPDRAAMVNELERGAAAALGAPAAAVGLWDAEAGLLRFAYRPPGVAAAPLEPSSPPVDGAVLPEAKAWQLDPQQRTISGRAFTAQRATLVSDLMRDDPTNAMVYRSFRARSALSAPITAGDERLGVLVVYAPREPVFANSDLELIQLLADQSAIILESRRLIDQAAHVRAREEATRLKEDFLSSAAHDLKTPLTGMIAQAQLLQRRAQRNPQEPMDQVGLERLIHQGQRLKTLVLELLDASRFEAGGVIVERKPLDLAACIREVCARDRPPGHCLRVDAPEPLVGAFDRARIAQLVDNLVENAVKYSPEGGEIVVRAWRQGDAARLSVRDNGIGIPPIDLASLFDRFHRGSNVDDRRFAGLGLGLYFCRQIAEQHGGRIWAESALAQGSTFHVELPLLGVEEVTNMSSGRQKAPSPETVESR